MAMTHDHRCQWCGLAVRCSNKGCTEGELCASCEDKAEERLWESFREKEDWIAREAAAINNKNPKTFWKAFYERNGPPS